MTNYKMQYWLYAILNKKHGSEVKMQRDPLHAMYSVNRHGFTVTTNTTPLRVVSDALVKELVDGGYEPVQGHSNIPDNKAFMKLVGKERRYVTLGLERYMNSSKVALRIQGSIYRER